MQAFQRRSIIEPYVAAEGSGALIVLVDSTGPYHCRSIVYETIISALEHFGMPYRLFDLGTGRLDTEMLQDCAAVLIAQERVSAKLSGQQAGLLLQAVRGGTGLVNFDWDLRGYDSPLLELFGFENIDEEPFATDLFYVPSNDHPITRIHMPQALEKSQTMVSALRVDCTGKDVVCLVEGVLGKEQLIYARHVTPGSRFVPGHHPVVLCTRSGQGRAVQFTVSPRLWSGKAMGHGGRLDDIFWRAILWTVRKPFVANTIPPFVTMCFDDCTGYDNFRYLDACHKYGYIPLVGLFLDKIKEEHRAVLRQKVQTGQIEINTHGGFDYYERIYYKFGTREYTEAELRNYFEREDRFYDWLGVSPCPVVCAHFGEIGVGALRFLKERGRMYFRFANAVGLNRTDQLVADGYWPYGSLSSAYEPLPDDKDFFVFCAMTPQRARIDFLTGTTTWLHESPFNDVEKAADRAAESIRHGLNNAFYADPVTHEQKLPCLTLEQWDRILALAAERTADHEKIFTGHEHIGRYLKAKYSTRIGKAERADGNISFSLIGEAKTALTLSCYTESDGEIIRQFVEVPPFAGKSEELSI